MQGIKRIGQVFSIALTIFLALLLSCNLYTIAARHFTGALQPSIFGWSWAVVISGSMQPEINVNDLVVVHQQEVYEIGDIISYENGRSVVTHRIVDITDEGFITKGDLNNTADACPVAEENVVGRVAFAIPYIGLILKYLKTPVGIAMLVLIGMLLIEIPFLKELYRKEKGGRG